MYLRTRYYDSSIGAFTSEDPAKDGGNWYVYCGGDPIKFIDPNGLAARIVDNNQEAFEALQKLTDDVLYMDEKGKIWITETRLGKKVNGTELVRRILWEEEVTIVIEVNQSDSTAGFDPVTKVINLKTSGNAALPTYNSDGSGRSHGAVPELFIILGHELIHANHFIDADYSEPKGRSTWNRYYDENGNAIGEWASEEEMRTVGPIQWEIDTGRRNRNAINGDDITENDLRWENGIALRSGYRKY